MEVISLVWLKRDLRLTDHEPLCAALAAGRPVFAFYCFEPELVAAPQYDLRHWRFVWQSLGDLNRQLLPRQRRIHVFYRSVEELLRQLFTDFRVAALYSHLETGIRLTYDRDLRIQELCRAKGIDWHEFQQNGVQRGLRNRKTWRKDWYAYMQDTVADPDLAQWKAVPAVDDWYTNHRGEPIPSAWRTADKAMQPGGVRPARRYLQTFLEDRCRRYNQSISKPEASRRACSRLSPYLAWGNFSIRQVYQAQAIARKAGAPTRQLQSFASRLRWHCHFIQKFEMEDRMEFASINRGFTRLEKPLNAAYVQQWLEGQTGYPLVDACMRCLTATGYINFRMRAMLVSFLTHHLWQPWQEAANHLARLFLDFEPGIHYPQLQMQAGVTGINTVRIYNPIKQAEDHDAQGEFIARWCPELAALPPPQRLRPWDVTAMEQELFGFVPGRDYPLPIIPPAELGKRARKEIWDHRKKAEVRAENKRILRRHTLPGRRQA